MADDEPTTSLKAVHTNSFELLKRMNTHVIKKLKQRETAYMSHGSLKQRAKQVVTDQRIDISFIKVD